MSVISLRCELTCDRINESAVGLIISRRWRWMVTMDTWTGAVTPTPGRISTFPSSRGWTKISTWPPSETYRSIYPPNVWTINIPVLPIYRGIQLGNCCSGFPTPSHWLMPFALRSSARIGRCSCRWPPVRLVLPGGMRATGQELSPRQASSTWRVLNAMLCALCS